MTRHDIADIYGEELLEGMMLLDPPEKFDHCIVGIASRCGMQACAVYDRDKIMELLESEGMTHEEADEYISYNIEGAYVGETTPLVMVMI
jgi:hypothetical protein